MVTILAVLATVGFLSLAGYRQDALDARARANVRSAYVAVSADSAMAGASPRAYASHDAAYALSGAYLYAGGDPAALTGGAWGVS